MNKIKQSIKNKISIIYVPVVILSALLLFSLIYCIGGYKKNMKFYTDSYYMLTQVSASANEYKIAVGEYVDLGGDDYYAEVLDKYRNTYEKFADLYSYRFQYDTEIRSKIDDISVVYKNLDAAMKKLADAETEEQIRSICDDEIEEYIADIYTSMSSIMAVVRDEGNRVYAHFDKRAAVVSTIAVLSFVGLAAMLVYSVFFVRKKIIVPVCDIYEWTRLFKDGYCDMAELKYEKDDEIGRLAESFNIVKRKLAKANELKAQYDDAMKKLNREEEHKKSFVQQLYTEKRDKEAISVVAKHDGLTGLYNRATFDGIVNNFVNKKPEGTEGALFIIDMDNFKNVNDTLGHLAGDEALKLLAGNMRVVFTGDYLGRYGGDEFVAFVAGYKSEEELAASAEELCNKMNVRFDSEGKSVNLSVSIGVATTVGVSEYSELYMKADKALYYSKENGRNQYKFE